MKIILLSAIAVTLVYLSACGQKNIRDVAAYEFQNAWFWVCKYSEGTTEAELKAHTKRFANPRQTSWFFYFPDSVDTKGIEKGIYSLTDFAAKVVEKQPSHANYIMAHSKELNEDAIDLMKTQINN